MSYETTTCDWCVTSAHRRRARDRRGDGSGADIWHRCLHRSTYSGKRRDCSCVVARLILVELWLIGVQRTECLFGREKCCAVGRPALYKFT